MKARIWGRGPDPTNLGPHWVEVDGAEPMVIKSFEEFGFFVYQEATSIWIVTEASSGMSINGGTVPIGRTRESAIRHATKVLRQNGIERFRRVVALNQHPECGEMPGEAARHGDQL